ncbi:MAG: hypothetical protein R6U27_15080 [Desulfobacterales bacterium]
MSGLLSTSNSDERMRLKDWGKVWLLGLSVAFVLLGGWEFFWRSMGFEPVVQDDWGVWAKVRREAVKQGDNAIILVGASRIQAGLHPDIFEQSTGFRPLVLAIDGSHPIPVLEHLAEDSRITGKIICSFTPMFLGEESEDFGRAQRWIRKYQEQKWSSRIETQLSLWVQQMLVFRYTGLLPDQIWENFRQDQWPNPPYAPMRADRYRPMDFTKTDVDRILEGRIEREKEFQEKADPLSEEPFMKKVQQIDKMVKKIEKRGGGVAFIRFPSTGVVRQLEDQSWPRQKYWDVLAANTRAETIHFEDYPQLSKYDCPDGSHLDVRDAKKFTRSLAEILMEQKDFVLFDIRTFWPQGKPSMEVILPLWLQIPGST